MRRPPVPSYMTGTSYSNAVSSSASVPARSISGCRTLAVSIILVGFTYLLVRLIFITIAVAPVSGADSDVNQLRITIRNQRAQLAEYAERELSVLQIREELSLLNSSLHVVLDAARRGERIRVALPVDSPVHKSVNSVIHSDIAVPTTHAPPAPVSHPVSHPSLHSSYTEPIAILLLTYNRPAYLRRTLKSVLKLRPRGASFPLFISQDGDHAGVAQVIKEFVDKQQSIGDPITPLRFKFKGIKRVAGKALESMGNLAYCKIASHYEWALGQVFDHSKHRFERVIILEDDMELAPDFFSYFRATAPLLDVDPTLMCVSAWNDNGQKRFVHDPTRLLRTDCFPGLGWMMPRSFWEEMKPKWPAGFWDDWLREPQQRRNRACIRPEMNRVFTFGAEGGASSGQFYHQFLSTIELNREPVDFDQLNPLGTLTKDKYDEELQHAISQATLIDSIDHLHTMVQTPAATKQADLRWAYRDLGELTGMLNRLGLMTDHKAGVPRGSYMGVLPFANGARTVYLYPHNMRLE